jgi:hypothetical protein
MKTTAGTRVIFTTIAFLGAVGVPAAAQTCSGTLTGAPQEQNSTFTDPNMFGGHWNAQTFTALADGCLTSITFSIMRHDGPHGQLPGDLGVQIYNTVPRTCQGSPCTKPVVPLGLGGVNSPLANAIVPAASVSTSGGDITVTFSTPPILANGAVYALVLHQMAPGSGDVNSDGGVGNAYYAVGLDNRSGNNGILDQYAGGQYWRTPPTVWNSPPGDGALLDFADFSFCIDTNCGGSPPQGLGCTNTVGSVCCGLTQGAFGNSKTVATSLGNNDCCNPIGFGLLPAAACSGVNVFYGDPNATTIGIHNTRSVTIGGGSSTPNAPLDGACSGTPVPLTFGTTFGGDMNTLLAYLPATGTPDKFSTSGPNAPGSDTHYTAANQVPCKNSGNSCGNGAGTLAGNAMATAIDIFISNAISNLGGITYPAGFLPPGFDGFSLPPAGTLLCTKRSGADKTLGTGDDVCQAFAYPSCVASKTVGDVLAAADSYLANGSDLLGCNASELNASLYNITNQFDQCGQVIACPVLCAFGRCSNTGKSCSGDFDCAGVFACP